MKTPDSKSLFLISLGFLLPMLAAHTSRKVVGRGYKLITKEDPPQNPASLDVDWKDALLWAAVTGLVGGMSRLAVRRWLSETIIPSKGNDMDEEIDEIK
jgi:hypothetical protein